MRRRAGTLWSENCAAPDLAGDADRLAVRTHPTHQSRKTVDVPRATRPTDIPAAVYREQMAVPCQYPFPACPGPVRRESTLGAVVFGATIRLMVNGRRGALGPPIRALPNR